MESRINKAGRLPTSFYKTLWLPGIHLSNTLNFCLSRISETPAPTAPAYNILLVPFAATAEGRSAESGTIQAEGFDNQHPTFTRMILEA